MSSSERRKLPLTLGLSESFLFFFWLLDWFWKKEETRILHYTIVDIININGKKKNRVNIFDQLLSFESSHTASPSSKRWPANFGFLSVFVLFQSTSWNKFLILKRPSTLDFLLLVTCKSNKCKCNDIYKRRVQNMLFL